METALAILFGLLACAAFAAGTFLAFEFGRGLKRTSATVLYGGASGFLVGVLLLDAIAQLAPAWSSRVVVAMLLVALGYMILLGVNALLVRSLPLQQEKKVPVHLPRAAIALVLVAICQATVVVTGIAARPGLGFYLLIVYVTYAFVDGATVAGILLQSRTPRDRIKQFIIGIAAVTAASGALYFVLRYAVDQLLPVVVGMMVYTVSRSIPELLRQPAESKRGIGYLGVGIVAFGIIKFISSI